MKKDNFKNKRGFSLIETLIAVSILMIAIAGPLSLVQAGLFSSIQQRNQVIATYLAQEAIEYIKNIRDTNFYQHYGESSAWLNGPDNETSLIDTCSNSCYVDPRGELDGEHVKAVDGPDLLHLRQYPKNVDVTNPVFSYYGYGSGGDVTPYTRTVKMESIVQDEEVKVSVTVGWNDHSIARHYTVSENIYNYETQKNQ